MKIKINGVETQVFSAELLKAKPPAAKPPVKLLTGLLSPINTGKKRRISEMLDLASTGCTARLLLSDRTLICVTEMFIPVDQIIAISTSEQRLYFALGVNVSAKISVRRLLDAEQILVNQLKFLAGQHKTDQEHTSRAEITENKTNDYLKKMDADIQMLKERKADDKTDRDAWYENPLGGFEARANFTLTMKNLGIKGNIVFALLRFAYGQTRKEVAVEAHVSEKTISRNLAIARDSQYANLFTRTRLQKIEASKLISKPDKAWSNARQLAKRDPDQLRNLTEQLIQQAQYNDEVENS